MHAETEREEERETEPEPDPMVLLQAADALLPERQPDRLWPGVL